MPIYEYMCRSCGEQAEMMQRMSEPPATDCPACGKPELSKLVSAAGFRLGGSGWYETDFKSSDKKKNLAKSTDAPAASTCSPSGCDKPGCAAAA